MSRRLRTFERGACRNDLRTVRICRERIRQRSTCAVASDRADAQRCASACCTGAQRWAATVVFLAAFLCAGMLSGCAFQPESESKTGAPEEARLEVRDAEIQEPSVPSPDELRANLDMTEDYRTSFDHGSKGPEYQKYIVLHDTEGDGSASSVVDYWDGNGAGVAAHFIIDKDGGIVQCVPLDAIAHHAGYGDTGHNESYGVTDESRDDKLGTTEPLAYAKDYGMNSYSVGIEMVHVGGSGDYPTAQLESLDALIAYIDAYYGFESRIIDHKAWRTGNSDTSEEFAAYLANYQDHRSYK